MTKLPPRLSFESISDSSHSYSEHQGQPPVTFKGLICKCGVCVIAALLVACSESPGGGGIGGTGKAIAPDTLIVGVVDGFGSVILNDQRYETTAAAVKKDQQTAELSDLRIGMVVTARVNSQKSEALLLNYQPDVSGVVTSVAEDVSQFSILGQKINLNADTMFDELALSEIVPGIGLEVSGIRNAEHAIMATLVRRSESQVSSFVVGRVEEGPHGAGAIVGNAVIDVSNVADEVGLTEEAYIATYMEYDTTVRVEALVQGEAQESNSAVSSASSQATTLYATNVVTIVPPTYNFGDRIQLLGAVGSAVSEGTFLVANVVIAIDESTEIVSNFGMPMEIPVDPRNRKVLVDGVVLGGDDTVLVNRIKFLDEN